MPSQALNRLPLLALAGAAVLLVNVVIGLALVQSARAAVVLAAVPAVLLLAGLLAAHRAVLAYAAVGLGLLAPLPVDEALPIGGPAAIYPSDVLVALALLGWLVAWLVSPEERARARRLRTPVLGWPLVIFAAFLLVAIVQGYVRYGEPLFSLPLRLVLYAGIAAAMTDLRSHDVRRAVTRIFYAGTVWQGGVAVYDLATGQASTAAVSLSTGGERVLAGSTAMYMAAALLLALLNFDQDRRASRSAVHLAVAGLATFALVVTFQRTTFALVALLLPLLLLAFRRVSRRALAFVPLCAPFVVLLVLLVPRADPSLGPTLADRLTASPSTDTSASWRSRATSAVWAQVREAPVAGVGFGRDASFVVDGVRTVVRQDPHDQFLYLWAGGGLLLLGSFALLLVSYFTDAWRRFRASSATDRRLVFWAASVCFVVLANSATGIVLTVPHLLLFFWIVLILPAIVPHRTAER